MSEAPAFHPQPSLPAFLARRPWAVRTIYVVRWLFPLALLAYVGFKLSELGWRDMWAARPGNPGFYVMLVAQFFLQPLGDFLVYRNLWGTSSAPPLSVILRKRFLNSAMLDYSGEVFFYFWAQARLKLPPGMLLHAIKDSNVLSAGAGLAMVWIMALALLATGGLQIPASVNDNLWVYLAIGSIPLWLCAILVLGHRKVTVLSRGQIAATFGIHMARSFCVLTVEFFLWYLSGALPTAVACLQFVALRLVVTRLPMVPNKDLIYVGAGIAAAGMANLDVTPIATVLVILAAADLGLVTLVAGIPWALEQFRKRHAA
jgi:hypothetical protein